MPALLLARFSLDVATAPRRKHKYARRDIQLTTAGCVCNQVLSQDCDAGVNGYRFLNLTRRREEAGANVVELPADINVSSDKVVQLVSAVATIASEYAGLAERRAALLAALLKLVNGQAGVWAWGRGWPDSSTVVPVAVIDYGVNDQQRGALMAWGLDAETERTFRQPVRAQLGNRRAVTTLWQDIFTPEAWEARPAMRSQLAIGGWGSWLHSVRYSDRDTWSNFFLLRDDGRGDFDRNDAALVHLTLESVPWLHSAAEEYLPPEAFAHLTSRQRTVMLMLLDGMPRKTIARRLEIAEDTVGDHLKAIYAHFQVQSATELAALFLRSR